MDISTISQLIQQFVSAEKESLNNQNIKHPTTIGSMYEGLTQEILNRSIFKGLGLRVVTNSFIEGYDVEFDVMLVVGSGKQLPYTNRYEFKPESVIAIIQVKKNLYSKDLKEGYQNLQFIVDNYDDVKPTRYHARILRDAFRAICRKDISSNSVDTLFQNELLIYDTLRIESILPVRIVWGYNGFSNEYNFRKSFLDYLEQNISSDVLNKIPGFGPHNFPSLIICNKYSFIKHNGMPFGFPALEDNWWPFYTSSSYNPTYFFLEAIWSRLSYIFEILPMDIFGEDLSMEPTNRFLDVRIKKVKGHLGWEFNYFNLKKKTLSENVKSKDWEPVQLDETQHAIVSELCKKGEIDFLKDEDLETFITMSNYSSVEQFIDQLKETGLVFLEKNKLKLLTDQCQCVMLPDGKFYAGENKSGRLTNWVKKEMKKYRN